MNVFPIALRRLGGALDFEMSGKNTSSHRPGLIAAVLRLLGHRYGDGSFYLRDDEDRGVYDEAVSLGYISSEGFLTSAGRALLAEHRAD